MTNTTPIPDEPLRISPSYLVFDYNDCPACFYAHVVDNEKKPPVHLPGVFSKIDAVEKHAVLDAEATSVLECLPEGRIWNGGSVCSAPIAVPGQRRRIVVAGKPDVLIRSDYRVVGGKAVGGRAVVVDLKTSPPAARTLPRYLPQLAAYAYALAHPATAEPVEVTGTGLLCFAPSGFEIGSAPERSAMLTGGLTWLLAPYDEHAFLELIAEVAELCSGPTPPNPDCIFCELRSLRKMRDELCRMEQLVDELTPVPDEVLELARLAESARARSCAIYLEPEEATGITKTLRTSLDRLASLRGAVFDCLGRPVTPLRLEEAKAA